MVAVEGITASLEHDIGHGDHGDAASDVRATNDW